ncbi:MAG TPA: hypothetical protein VK457_23360 [Chloroflexota bacterium]|nr:hypothetical protein [Chloroflexota bacterium]
MDRYHHWPVEPLGHEQRREILGGKMVQVDVLSHHMEGVMSKESAYVNAGLAERPAPGKGQRHGRMHQVNVYP